MKYMRGAVVKDMRGAVMKDMRGGGGCNGLCELRCNDFH